MKIDYDKIGKGSRKIFFTQPLIYTKELELLLEKNDLQIFYFTSSFFKKLYALIPKKLTVYGYKVTEDKLRSLDDVEWYSRFMTDFFKILKSKKIYHVLAVYYFFSFKQLDFLKQLGVFVSCIFADDPEDTKIISGVFGPKYDSVICVGVQYNENQTIVQKLKSVGCMKVRFLPIPPNPLHYDLDVNFNKKDIDLVYIGGLVWKKWIRLSKIHRKFPKRLLLYSAYDPRKVNGLRSYFYKFLNLFYPLPDVNFIKDEEVKEIYKRTKIGFNLHNSYGPSNSRTYELCLNGCLQITDNFKGTSKIFKVGVEVLCYKDLNSAVELINKYLNDDFRRILIAKRGFRRAANNYTYEKNLFRFFMFVLEEN